MAEVYKNYIGGKWVDASSGQTFESINPANRDEIIGIFQRSGKDDVVRAIDAAQAAFRGWSTTPAPTRADIVLKVALLLEQHKEELAALETCEMGKVLDEGRGDVQ